MASDLLSFPEEEELEYEEAIVQVVQPNDKRTTGLNLVTSRSCVHDKSSAAFLKACSLVREAAFWRAFYRQITKRTAFLAFDRSYFFALFCLFLAGLKLTESVQNLAHRVQKLWVQDKGKVILGTRMKVRDFLCT